MIDELTRKAIVSLISRKAGLNFPSSHWGDLDRGIHNTCEELKIKDHRIFIKQLLEKDHDPNLFETLINNLTIGETYFFREKPILDAFTEKVIPQIVKNTEQNEKVLNIWCAGCCTGEEPYTIAILIKEHIPDLQDWKIKIIATDINKKFLNKALQGKYSAWSFRETPPDLRKKYFTPDGHSYIILPEIRKMVTFSRLNLADVQHSLHGINPEQINVIFCRNVLMYFTPEFIQTIYESFNNVLVKGGWLITSSVEIPAEVPSGFRFRRLKNVTLLQKPDVSDTTEEPEIQLRPTKNYKALKFSTPKPKSRASGSTISAPGVKPVERKVAKGDILTIARRAYGDRSYGEVIRLLEINGSTTVSEDIYLLLIKSYANQGQLEKARQLCEKLLEQHPQQAFYFQLHASVLIELGQEGMAEVSLRKSLYLDPDMVLSHYLMGNLLRRKGETSHAQKHFRNILKIVKDLPDEFEFPESDGMTAGYIKAAVQTLL